MVQEFEPDVVVCDEQADGFTWREVLDVASAAPVPPAVLVVLPRFDASTWFRVLRSGAGEIVCEPLSAEKLVDAVERAARLTCRDERKSTRRGEPGRSRLLAVCRSVLGLGAAPRP
jgi:DNA-binding NarL/FixJ family response regulator